MRKFLLSFLFLSLAMAGSACATTIPCAIRWDAWYGGSGTGAFANPQVQYALGVGRFQQRAPFFATPTSSSTIVINGNQQATMDQEIAYAKNANVKCWAFLWYSSTDGMQNAWNLYQTSTHKTDVNWCLNLALSVMQSSAVFATQIPAFVTYMQQSNYQTVSNGSTGGHPLLFLLFDSPGGFASGWGGSYATLAASITALNSALATAGLPTAYVVMQSAPSAANAATAGMSAISQYATIPSSVIAQTYASFDTAVQATWATAATAATAASIGMVPNAMVGRDSRARKVTPQGFAGTGIHAHFGESIYAQQPTAAELTSHLQAAVTFIGANAAVNPSQVTLIYAWDECDEFGCMMPTYNSANPASPNMTILNAVGAVTW
jgi:hypothetical protein